MNLLVTVQFFLLKQKMTLLELLFLVLPIPLASIYLSTILITDLLFIESLSSCYISEIHGGLFQLTLFSQSLEIFILILGSFFTQSVEQFNTLLSFTPSFQDSFLLGPVIVYSNADTEKLRILSDNKGLAGVYMWK